MDQWFATLAKPTSLCQLRPRGIDGYDVGWRTFSFQEAVVITDAALVFVYSSPLEPSRPLDRCVYLFGAIEQPYRFEWG